VEQNVRPGPFNVLFRVQSIMAWSFTLALLALGNWAIAQSPSDVLGAALDAPMLGGGRRTGSTAMLRFGCSELVVERLDP